jgi:uncharacterized protein (DUF58 family)
MNALRNPKQRRNWKRMLQQIATREHCEWASPYLAWLRQPLGILVLSGFAALICGLFAAPQGFVVFAAIVAVVAIGCVWPWIGICGVRGQLRFAAGRTEEGKPVEVELAVTNRWPWPVWGLAVEGGFLQQEASRSQPAIAVSRIEGWSRSYFRWRFVPELRGRYPVAHPYLVTEFPFGLWKANRRIDVGSTLIVWPARFALPPLVLPCGRQSWAGQPSECAAGSLGHRTTVREYRRGDSLRQIHWAKAALYDKLVSYEREGFAVADAMISLDTHPALHRGSGRDSSVEWTIRIAASICDALLRQGINVTVTAHAGQFRAHSAGNSPAALLDWFALLNTGDVSASRSTRRTCSVRRAETLTIHITTDLAGTFANDSIIYLTESSFGARSGYRRSSQGWMTVTSGADVPSQIRSGWRNGPRSFHHAF